MNAENTSQQLDWLKQIYQQMSEPAVRSILGSAIALLEKQGSESEAIDDLPPQEIPKNKFSQTSQQKNILSGIKSDDEFETKGDNLEAGASADNPIDSKTLSYEAQAQLPIGTWVTTSKGPHRINQGDKNWAKQMMQKQSTAKVKPMTEQSSQEQTSQEDDVQAELEGAPRVFAEDSNSWDIRKKNSMGNVAVTNVSLIPQNVQTYGDLLQLKADYGKAYNEARDNMANHQDADAYAKRKVGMNCIGNGGSVIDEVIRNAQNVMDSERKKTAKAAAKTEKAAQKQIYESSPEGKAAAQKAREDAAARAAERAERNADRHDR